MHDELSARLTSTKIDWKCVSTQTADDSNFLHHPVKLLSEIPVSVQRSKRLFSKLATFLGWGVEQATINFDGVNEF